MLFQFDCGGEHDKPKGSLAFIVKVDSISHPQTVALYDTIKINMFGTIGTDGCSSFLGYDETKQPLRLDLTIRGERKSSDACPAVMVYLDGKEYKTIANQVGWYSINIHQPDNSVLKDSINVK